MKERKKLFSRRTEAKHGRLVSQLGPGAGRAAVGCPVSSWETESLSQLPSGSWTRRSLVGGARGKAGHHSPQGRRIFSITSAVGGFGRNSG
jgi:hypothetical protein